MLRIQVQTDNVRSWLRIRIVTGQLAFSRCGCSWAWARIRCTVDLLSPNSCASFHRTSGCAVSDFAARAGHSRLHRRRRARGAALMTTSKPATRPVRIASSRARWPAGLHASRNFPMRDAIRQRQMSRARNTSPAGGLRDCAQRCNSCLCSALSLSSFDYPSYRMTVEMITLSLGHYTGCQFPVLQQPNNWE
jgi:hypothetical protein